MQGGYWQRMMTIFVAKLWGKARLYRESHYDLVSIRSFPKIAAIRISFMRCFSKHNPLLVLKIDYMLYSLQPNQTYIASRWIVAVIAMISLRNRIIKPY